MKIFQVLPEFGIGGAEIMAENLTNELIRIGHHVIVISLYNYSSIITDRFESSKIDIRYLGKKAGLDISIIPKLRSIIKQEHPDAIHTHRYVLQYVAPAAFGLNTRIIHTVHSVAQKENTKMARIFNNFIFKLKMAIPVALTEQVKDTIVEVYDIKRERIPVIYNGIPLQKCTQKTDYNFGNNIHLLHVGRYAEPKNHIEMIKAICQLHAFESRIILNLVGEGPLKDDISAIIKSNHAESYIIQHGPTNNVFDHMNKADIFILPSIYEGMPITLIEAMGSGIPILASNVGGIPDMIENAKEGILCTPDAYGIISKIKEMILDKDLREFIGKQAYIASKKFSVEKMAKKYVKLYTDGI